MASPLAAAAVETATGLPPASFMAEKHLMLTSPPHPHEETALAITLNPQQEVPLDEQAQPCFIDSITGLRGLSAALSAFHRRYDELQEHLDFIRTAIDAQLQKRVPLTVVPLTEALPSETQTLDAESADSERIMENKRLASPTEVETLCKTMSGRGLRKYIVSHLSEVSKLREEIPAALKLAPNPAKVVMDCVGRFFLQGIKAFSEDSQMLPARQASILVLECFLKMGCKGNQIETAAKEEAHEAALAWRKRLIKEGGVAKAGEMDARGLLLLIGCFGIPKLFKNEDIKNLVKASKPREISDALRRSTVLLAKIPEIIDEMLKNRMEVGVIDLAYTFGIEDRFPPQTILTSFLRESKETWKRAKSAAHNSFEALSRANKKQLSDLKSVIKCLEDHGIDPSKLLPGWQLKDKISSLEREIVDLDKKIAEQVIAKRRADETESSILLENQEVKRARLAGPGLQQQMVAAYAYDSLARRNMMDGSVPGYYSPSVPHGAGAGTLTGAGAGMMAAGAGIAASTCDLMGQGNGNFLVDRVGNVFGSNSQPYGWHGETAVRETLAGYRYAEPAVIRANGLYGTAQSLQGYAGLGNASSIAVSNRSSSSDLYHFADAVVETELSCGGDSQTGRSIPSVASAYRSSYLH